MSEYYENCIESIQNYFNISTIAAKYIYHRRKHGLPYRNIMDPKYLQWSNKLLNALLQADNIINLNWEDIIFGKEYENLALYGIIVDNCSDEFPHTEDNTSSQPSHHEEKSSETESNEWVTVQSKHKQKQQKKKYTVKNKIISKLFL